MAKHYPERVNWIKTENCYVGATVNMPLVAQAKNLPLLKKRLKELSQAYLRHMTETLNHKEPFEFKRLTIEEWRNLK